MEDIKARAEAILREFKGDAYAFGNGILDEAAGKFAAQMGKKAMVVGPIQFEWYQPIRERILKSLDKAGVELVDVVRSAALASMRVRPPRMTLMVSPSETPTTLPVNVSVWESAVWTKRGTERSEGTKRNNSGIVY